MAEGDALPALAPHKLEAFVARNCPLDHFARLRRLLRTHEGIRYLDKLIDKLAKGKAMDKILRED